MTTFGELLRLAVEALTDIDILPEKPSRDDHNWPTTTAVEKLDRHLPMEYPFERDTAAWPPFMGARVELGG